MDKTEECYIPVRSGGRRDWPVSVEEALAWAAKKSYMPPPYAIIVQTVRRWERRCTTCGHRNRPILKEETLSLAVFLERYGARVAV